MTPATLALFKSTPKAISVHEAFAIEWLAGLAPKEGICATLGSHAGGDSIAACSGIKREQFSYYAIDPCYNLQNEAAWAESVQGTAERMPWHYVNAPGFNAAVESRLRDASDWRANPILCGMSAKQWLNVMSKNQSEIAYLFSDADDHNYEQIMAEVEIAAPLLVTGGIVVFHDFGNYTGPVQAHRDLLQRGGWENVSIPWDEIRQRASEAGGEAGNNSWHCCDNPAPCFVGALRKV
jgi:hypothetical protein